MKKKTKDFLNKMIKEVPNAKILLGITVLILLSTLAYVLILYLPKI